jgi:diketogulonate reductase-like aldo/keto reductase
MDARRRALLGTLAGLALTRAAIGAQRMHTRSVPSSGEALPVIGLGTWQTFDVGGDAVARAPLKEVLQALFDAGGRLVDSSPMYGSSESVVGDLCGELGVCEPLFMATKVWTQGREEGIRQMRRSVERMRAGRMDLMQVHNLLDVEEHTKTLQAWKSEKRVRYIGVTHYTASAHGALERWMKTKQYDFVQVNYSLEEREAGDRLLPLAQDLGIAVLINRPFATGGVFRRTRGKPLPPWAAQLGIESWAQYFLKWIVAHPAVTCVIPATSKPAHMRDNAGAGLGAMPDAAQRERMAQYYASL